MAALRSKRHSGRPKRSLPALAAARSLVPVRGERSGAAAAERRCKFDGKSVPGSPVPPILGMFSEVLLGLQKIRRRPAKRGRRADASPGGSMRIRLSPRIFPLRLPAVSSAGLSTLLCLGVGLGVGVASAQIQTTDQQRCTNAMNLGLLRSASARAAEVVGCLGNGIAGSREACARADARGKVAKADAKAASDFAKKCTGTSRKPPGAPKRPPFGVTDAETVRAAGEGAHDLFHDAFGIDLDVAAALDEPGGLCQKLVAKELRACQAAKLREFNACKKAGLKRDSDPFDDAADLASCFGADPKGKAAKRCDLREEVAPDRFRVDGIRKQLAKKCVAKGVDLGRALPGCGSADVEATHACLERAVACRSCLAIARADGLDLDCDTLDDGLVNASCGLPIGRQECRLDPDSSFLFDSRAGFLGGGLGGRIEIDCGSPDEAGRAACRCGLAEVTPVEVPSVGWTCIDAVPGCASGETSCEGGTSLDFTLRADHDIGPCSGNAECAARCETACTATGAAVFDSGCEGFCEGGASDTAACASDAQCPGGRCNGVPGGAHGNGCQCQCLDTTGEPSTPGGLRCQVGARIRIETALPCDGTDVVLDLGDRCFPFTSETAQATLVDQDHVPGRMLPAGIDLIGGKALACETLRTEGPGGMIAVSAANAFDVPGAGDVYLLLAVGCE
jgi:hypothetical protein